MKHHLAFAAALLLAACSKSASPPTPEPDLDLSIRLPAGKARAGQVRRPEELIGGPTARGKVGDFKIYNSRVAFIIENAVSASGYSPYGGKILDADLVRAPGEAGRSRFGEWIVGFDFRFPNAQRVTTVQSGEPGGSAVLRVEGPDGAIPLLDAVLEGILQNPERNLWITVDYILDPDADYLRVETTVENRSAQVYEMQPRMGLLMGDGAQPWLPGLGFETATGTYPFYAALGPDVSYGIFSETPLTLLVVYNSITIASLDSVRVAPAERKTVKTFVAVGAGDTVLLARSWRAAAHRQEALVEIRGRVEDGAGAVIPATRVHAIQTVQGDAAPAAVAMTGADGTYLLELPAGQYQLRATPADLPPSDPATVTVASGVQGPTLRVASTGRLRFEVKDEGARALPAKIIVRATGTTTVPSLHKMYGARSYAAGAARVVFSPSGSGEVPLAPGSYRVYAARGFEYDVAQADIEVAGGATVVQSFTLRRVVDTTGWLSGDFHIHAQTSPDSDDLDEEKVAAFVAEGLEVPISTDHEFVNDYAPTIQRMGLEGFVRSIVGEEVSTTHIGHFNAFPLQVDPTKLNRGFIPWYFKKGPEIFAEIRANPGVPVLQVNHPRSTGAGGYFEALDLEPVTGTVAKPEHWSDDFDAIEVVNGKGLWEPTEGVFKDWYGFLNRDKRATATGNSDSHAIYRSEPGYPRNYVRVPSDDLAAFDARAFVDGVKAGQVVVSGGPFLTASIGGKGPGETAMVPGGEVAIDVVVQAPSWMNVNRLVVVSGGAEVYARDLTGADADPANPVVRFRGTIPVRATQDAWYVVHVRGPGTLEPVVPSGRPFAFTNAIFVDVDGNGRFDAL
jgi:hypothetical protein